jgi:hypothetical protein
MLEFFCPLGFTALFLFGIIGSGAGGLEEATDLSALAFFTWF